MDAEGMAGRKPVKRRRIRMWKGAWKRLTRNVVAMICIAIILLFAFVAVFAEQIIPFSAGIRQNVETRLLPPSRDFPFGTDHFGRDYFSRMVHGSRVSLTVGIWVSLIVLGASAILGGASAFYGGWFDVLVMRICDLLLSIPPILLTLLLIAVLGPGRNNMLIGLSVASIPGATRTFRAIMLNVIANDYIAAAKISGCGDFRIIIKLVVPNVMAYMILSFTTGIPNMIIQISSLSFIGLGIQPPNPEWGALLSTSREYMRQSPHLFLIPCLAILIVNLAFSLLGDSLRDVLDPRLRSGV